MTLDENAEELIEEFIVSYTIADANGKAPELMRAVIGAIEELLKANTKFIEEMENVAEGLYENPQRAVKSALATLCSNKVESVAAEIFNKLYPNENI